MNHFFRTRKFNPNHGPDGRFTSGEGATFISTTNAKTTERMRETHPASAKGFLPGETREQYNARRMAQAMREGTAMTWEQAKAKEQDQYSHALADRELKVPRAPGMNGRLEFPAVKGGTKDHHGEYAIQPARYARGKVLVQAPGQDGFKTRAGRLAEAVGGHYTNREHGYTMSPKQAEKFHLYYRFGHDASPITNTIQFKKPGP
jgi:hypothetical protein